MTAIEASPDTNLYSLFADHAANTPDAIAIVHQEEITYRELEARAEVICAFLHDRGVVPEEPIGVAMQRTPDMVATLLALLRSGASYVPCDPDHPVARINRMFKTAQCSLVLSDRSVGPALAGPIEINYIEDISGDISCGPLTACAPGGSRLAYTMFTSGSTGEAKGVEVEHRSLLNLLIATRDLIEFTSADRYFAASTIGFDISVAELFVPLITGGSLLLCDRTILVEPGRLANEISEHGVTVVQTGPSVWDLAMRQGQLPHIRIAVSTGEAISPDIAARLVEHADHVWNLYGPTEATVWATGKLLGSSGRRNFEVTAASSAPIGSALANMSVIVADEIGRQVPDGQRGELWIGGVGLARGYCNNPPLTKERFVIGPGGHRFYRTGDLVSMSGGVLDYLGRNDDQVQVHGVRVEPAEIEAAMRDHPAVAQAASTWFEITDRDRAIGVAVVLNDGMTLSTEALRRELARELPSQMVPARVIFVDSIPLSPSGKVARGAIRAALVQWGLRDSRTDDTEDGSTATTLALCQAFEAVLGVSGVGTESSLLDLGGDSIAAFRVILEIEDSLGKSVNPVELFEYTIGELSSRIDQANPRPTPTQ